MRTYRAQKGPFQERPFYKQEEVESLCQEELAKHNLLPASPEPIRIERFIEKRFKVTPVYEELPSGVLGFTRFNTNGVEAIVISRSLSEEESRIAERRITTTLAHEAGHGLLHAHLFVVGSQPGQLFGDEYDPKAPKILCRDEPTDSAQGPKYNGKWWEFQANLVIGALLLPKILVVKSLEGTVLKSTGSFGLPQLKSQDRGRAVKVLSDTFNVNPVVAKIRLDQLLPENESAQLTF